MSDFVKFLFFGMLALCFIALGPIAVLWSLNTMFPALAIPYTFKTWLATLFLFGGWTYNKS